MCVRTFECVCACYVGFSKCASERTNNNRRIRKHTHTQSVTWKNQNWLCMLLQFCMHCHVVRTAVMPPAHRLHNTPTQLDPFFCAVRRAQLVCVLQEHFNSVFASVQIQVTLIWCEGHSGKSSPFWSPSSLRCSALRLTAAGTPLSPWCNAPTHLLYNQKWSTLCRYNGVISIKSHY